jgi:hypothetical protein
LAAALSVLGACVQPEALQPETRNTLFVQDVAFETGPFVYGQGVIGKHLSPQQIEPVFEEVIKEKLSRSSASLGTPVIVEVSFTRFNISTGYGMLAGGQAAAEAAGSVTLKTPSGEVLGLYYISETVSALFGDLPAGAFSTPDAYKIESLAHKFTAALYNDVHGFH